MKTIRALSMLKHAGAAAAAIACLLLLLAAPATAQAQPQFGYMTNAGGTTATITNYTGPGGAVAIPTNLDGLTVTGIGTNAFYGNTNLTSVTIPNSVTNIGVMAFYECSDLTSVTIGTNVTSIEEGAFAACESLTSVTIPGSVTSTGDYAFQYCTSLTNVTILNGVASIGDYEFYACSSLTSITIPGSLTSIGYQAFCFCSNLTSVPIPDSVISIGGGAFGDCTSLTSVPIPGSVTSIGDYAFQYCTSLTSAYFLGNAPSADSTVFTGDTNATVYYLADTTGWSSPFAGRPAVLRFQATAASITGFGGNGAGWTLNNNGYDTPASVAGNLLTIVDGYGADNSAFYNAPQNISNFTASFVWQNTVPYNGYSPADGMVFTLQNQGVNALGTGGGGFGYEGISPASGVAFNLWTEHTVGIGYGPSSTGNGSDIYQSTGSVNFDSTDPIAVTIIYTNGLLNIFLTDTTTLAAYNTNFNVNLTGDAGGSMAYVGFTGGSGEGESDQTISDFIFTPSSSPDTYVQYTASSTVGPAPLAVQFNSPSTDSYGNPITQWFWSFGDGGTTNSQNPNYTYTNNGTYSPTLQGIDTTGATVAGIGPSITLEAITGLVSNGGFETGDFTGWSLSGDTNDMVVSTNFLYAHAGNHGAQLGPKRGALSQTLSTTPGTPYLLSFWLDSADYTTNEFGVSWGTNTLFDQTDIGPIGWTNVVLEVTATQTNTLLNFMIQNAVSWFGLDAVDVEALLVAPASQTVECGSTATFSVVSNNEAFVSYQWYGLPPAANSFPIPGATNSVLTLTNVSEGPAVSYYVVCSNSSGSFTSAMAPLTVIDATPPPVIMPASQTVECGSTVTFSVTNEASAISYQWYSPDLSSSITGATNAVLAFTNVSVGATNYIVVITTSCGSYLSAPATLTVVDTTPPVITLIGANPMQVVVNGSFTDPGATADDSCAGTNVVLSTNGSVNTSVPGYYTITYTATDPSDNSTTNTRTVQVVLANYDNLVLNTANLLGYWPFTPSSQANSIVNGYTGTNMGDAFVGSPGSGPSLADDMPNNTAVILDGNSSYVNTSLVGGLGTNGLNTNMVGMASGSIIGWFNLSTLPSTAGSIFTIAGESQPENDFTVQIDTNNEIEFLTDMGSFTADTNALTANDLNVWHFVAATFTSYESRNLYLDGVLVANSAPGFHYPGSGSTFAIGGNDVLPNRYFQGALADIAVFNSQLTATEVANFYAAATSPLSVSISSPTNLNSFTTNQSITFGASATAINGVQQLALYVNSVLVASDSTTNISTILSNLPVGSYVLTAVVTDFANSVTNSTVHVTVNNPGTTLIDFDALDASAGPVSGADLSAYLAIYGVTVTNVTAGTTLAVQEDQNILNGTATVAYSDPNLLTQYGTNGAISYTLVFNTPCTSVSWERTELLASSSGLLGPAWSAYAFDGEGNEISQIGEGQIFSLSNIPAKAFTLSGSNIFSVTFEANNTLSTLAALPLDNLLLSTNALGPIPQITLTASNVVSAEPGQITLAAQASETGGTISRIDFYENQGLIGSAVSLNGTNVTASLTVTSLAPGTYTFNAVATDGNGVVTTSTNVNQTVTPVAGVSVINFDNLSMLNTFLGAVGGTNLSNYLANFGITISNATLGTRLEAISENSFSGNELPMPTSLPNLFTQVGSRQPMSFSLYFATNLQSFSFTRVGMNTNGPSGISHPAWSAHILDGSGNELESVSEPLLFSLSNIPPRTFTLYGSGIASVRFDSDSQQTAAFAAVLLDDLVLDANPTTNTLSISLTPPDGSFTAPASIPLSPNVVDGFGTNFYVAFYSGPTLIGTNSGGASTFLWTNVLNGSFILKAEVVDASGYALLSAPVTVTVNPGGSSLVVNFDDANAVAGLSNYLATNGMMSIASNSPGTAVAVENQANVAGGGFVIPSSLPNLLTQTGSSGPVSFTVGFSNLLGQFSFTRPELLANPSVTHPAWQVQAFDALGQPLAAINGPQISSSTNVPAQTYTLTNAINGGGIASVEFNSESTGFATFNAMLLDDFVLTTGSNLPPSVLITSPTNGQVFTDLTNISITAEATNGSATITGVAFYYNGAALAGSAQSSPFSITWNAPTNGAYVLTAVATNNSSLESTSAPVSIAIQTGFAIVTQPTNQTVGVSNSATFSVTTSPTNGVSYQWRSNGIPLSGATLSSYTAGSAQNSAPGSSSYSVIASGYGQSLTSSNAVLTVLGPPTISSTSPLQPVVNIGDTVTLSVSGNDLVPFYYQWQLNGQFIAGATNSFYTISNAQPFNSGNYRVLVANAVASQESPTFAVAVNFGSGVPTTNNDNFASSIPIDPLIGPVAGINNSSSSPPADGPSPIAGKPAAGFLWYNWTASFTGVISLTTLGSGFDTLLGVYTGSYPGNLTTIAEDDDSGGFFTSLVSFNCVQGTTYQIAVAGFKGATGNVVLGLAPGTGYRLLDPNSGDAVPVITQQPASQIVAVGATVTNSVTASNATTYQWYFAGAPVSSVNSNIVVFTSATVAGVNTNFLVISNFPAGAAGNYYVLAANAVGGVPSQTAAIEFQNPAQTAGTPNTLMVDKFGDAVDLTEGSTTEHYRPEDAGGDVAGFTLSQSFSTVGATKEEGEPSHAGQPGGASYWYNYSAHFPGSLNFDTKGSSFNTILAVYTGPGDSFKTLVNVGAAYTTNYVQQGQPSVLVSNVTPSTKFYIAIDGYLGASGAARLNVYFTPTNVTLGSGAVSITNSQTVVAINSPANNSLTTSSNITVKGTFTGSGGNPPDGNVQVSVNGNAPTNATFVSTNYAGVLIQVNGGVEEVKQETIHWSIANVTLGPGANVITAQGINVESTNLEIASLPVTRTVFYVTSLPSPLVKSRLSLLTSPLGDGRITGQANNANLEINKVYTVKAVPIGNRVFTNWTSGTNANSLSNLSLLNPLSFLMSSNLILQANFVTNPFTALAGVYNGLFAPTNGVNEANSGFVTATIPASSRGAYSAKLLLDGGSYPFSGTFDLSLQAGKTVTRSGKTPLMVQLQLTNDQMIGSVNDAITDSLLQAYRALPETNYAGRYTLIIPPGDGAPTNSPGGYGYATLTDNRAGHVALSGLLGDGVAFSQSVPVATNGNIPLYASLYSRKGSLQGWLTLTNTTNNPAQTILGTNLTWIKISSRAGTWYAGGFTNTNITVLGSLYIPPAAGSSSLDLTNGTLTISNGNPAELLTYSNLTIVDNKLANQAAPGNPPNLLEGVITPGTGVLTVTFRPTGAHANIVAKGVVLQDEQTTNAAGWFLDTDQSGCFLLQQ